MTRRFLLAGALGLVLFKAPDRVPQDKRVRRIDIYHFAKPYRFRRYWQVIHYTDGTSKNLFKNWSQKQFNKYELHCIRRIGYPLT